MRIRTFFILALFALSFSLALSAAEITEEECLEVLRRATRDGDCQIRGQAAKVLGELISDEGLRLLGQLSRDDYWEVRAEAALALGKSGKPEAKAYLAPLLEDEFFYVRDRAGIGLAYLGEKTALPVLREALADIHDKIGILAVESLGKLKADERVVPLLREILRKEHHWMRGKACYVLTEVLAEAALPDLKEREESDPETYVRICVAGCRAKLGDYSGKELVLSYLEHPRIPYRTGAIKALSQFEPKEGIGIIEEKALKDNAGQVRIAAIEALEEMNSSGSAPVLLAILEAGNEDEEVKRCAALALGRLAGENIVSQLEKHFPGETSRSVKLALAVAILNLKEKSRIPAEERLREWQTYFQGKTSAGRNSKVMLTYDFSDPRQYEDFLENDGRARIEGGGLRMQVEDWMPGGDAITYSIFSKALFEGDIELSFSFRPESREEVFLTFFLNPLPLRPHGLGWWWYNGYFVQITPRGAEVRFQGDKIKYLGEPIVDQDSVSPRPKKRLAAGRLVLAVRDRRLIVSLSDRILFDIPHDSPLTEKEFVLGFGCYGPGGIIFDDLKIEGNFSPDWLSRQTSFSPAHQLPFRAEQIESWDKEKKEAIAGLGLRSALAEFSAALSEENPEKIKSSWLALARKYRSILGILFRLEARQSAPEIRQDLGRRSPVSESIQYRKDSLLRLEEHFAHLEEKYRVNF